jgi:hypothetical protein
MLGDHRDGEPAAGPLWYSLTLSSLLPGRQGNRTTFSASSFRSIPTGAFESIFVCRQDLFGIHPLVCQNAFNAGIEAVQEALVLRSAGGCTVSAR